MAVQLSRECLDAPATGDDGAPLESTTALFTFIERRGDRGRMPTAQPRGRDVQVPVGGGRPGEGRDYGDPGWLSQVGHREVSWKRGHDGDHGAHQGQRDQEYRCRIAPQGSVIANTPRGSTFASISDSNGRTPTVTGACQVIRSPPRGGLNTNVVEPNLVGPRSFLRARRLRAGDTETVTASAVAVSAEHRDALLRRPRRLAWWRTEHHDPGGGHDGRHQRNAARLLGRTGG